MTTATIERARRLGRYPDAPLPAEVRLAIARSEVAKLDWENTSNGAKATFERDGLTVTAAWSYSSQPVDLSWLGEFTDDPDGAVKNPSYRNGAYEFFRPEDGHDFDSLFEAYRRTMTVEEATRLARRAVEENAQTAVDLGNYDVEVTVTIDDVEWGYASMLTDWTDFDDGKAESVIDDYGMVDEAIADAWSNIEAAYGPNGRQLFLTEDDLS